MIGTNIYGDKSLGDTRALILAEAKPDNFILFNGLNLNDRENYYALDDDHEHSPQITYDFKRFALTDFGALLDSRHVTKKIVIPVIVTDTSKVLRQARMDDFKRIVEVDGANLDYDFAGDTRRYIASGHVGEVNHNILWSEAKLELASFSDYATGISNISEFFTPASGSDSKTINIVGSAFAEPIITATINSSTGTDKKIKITNLGTGEYIEIEQSNWSGKMLEIDYRNNKLTVKVDDVDVEYTGVFSEWGPGNVGLAYQDDLLTRNIDIEFKYISKYL